MDICMVPGLCSITSILVFVHLDNWSNSKTAKLSVGFATAMSALVLPLTLIRANQSSSLAFGQSVIGGLLGPWLCWLVLLALTVYSVKMAYTRLEELDEVTADDAGDNRSALLLGGRWGGGRFDLHRCAVVGHGDFWRGNHHRHNHLLLGYFGTKGLWNLPSPLAALQQARRRMPLLC